MAARELGNALGNPLARPRSATIAAAAGALVDRYPIGGWGNRSLQSAVIAIGSNPRGRFFRNDFCAASLIYNNSGAGTAAVVPLWGAGELHTPATGLTGPVTITRSHAILQDLSNNSYCIDAADLSKSFYVQCVTGPGLLGATSSATAVYILRGGNRVAAYSVATMAKQWEMTYTTPGGEAVQRVHITNAGRLYAWSKSAIFEINTTTGAVIKATGVWLNTSWVYTAIGLESTNECLFLLVTYSPGGTTNRSIVTYDFDLNIGGLERAYVGNNSMISFAADDEYCYVAATNEPNGTNETVIDRFDAGGANRIGNLSSAFGATAFVDAVPNTSRVAFGNQNWKFVVERDGSTASLTGTPWVKGSMARTTYSSGGSLPAVTVTATAGTDFYSPGSRIGYTFVAG